MAPYRCHSVSHAARLLRSAATQRVGAAQVQLFLRACIQNDNTSRHAVIKPESASFAGEGHMAG